MQKVKVAYVKAYKQYSAPRAQTPRRVLAEEARYSPESGAVVRWRASAFIAALLLALCCLLPTNAWAGLDVYITDADGNALDGAVVDINHISRGLIVHFTAANSYNFRIIQVTCDQTGEQIGHIDYSVGGGDIPGESYPGDSYISLHSLMPGCTYTVRVAGVDTKTYQALETAYFSFATGAGASDDVGGEDGGGTVDVGPGDDGGAGGDEGTGGNECGETPGTEGNTPTPSDDNAGDASDSSQEETTNNESSSTEQEEQDEKDPAVQADTDDNSRSSDKQDSEETNATDTGSETGKAAELDGKDNAENVRQLNTSISNSNSPSQIAQQEEHPQQLLAQQSGDGDEEENERAAQSYQRIQAMASARETAANVAGKAPAVGGKDLSGAGSTYRVSGAFEGTTDGRGASSGGMSLLITGIPYLWLVVSILLIGAAPFGIAYRYGRFGAGHHSASRIA